MAPNRRSEAEARRESSSEEEDGSSEDNEEQEESESESEGDKAAKKPSATKKPEATQASVQPQSSSSDDSGSGSESESDSPPHNTRRVDSNIKSSALKQMEEPSKATKKPRSKPNSAAPAAKSSATAKRAAESENNSDRDSKRTKKKKAATDADGGVVEDDSAKKTGDDAKKQLFQRLWSEEDEIEILKGMIEYKAKKKADPMADMDAFHDFIKKSVHVDVSKAQLLNKVRRLKKKYENNASKGKKGEDRTFSKPHEQKAYELSKKIWGVEANGVGLDSPKPSGKAGKNQSQRASVASPKVNGLASPERSKEGTKMEVNSNPRVPGPVQFTGSVGQLSLEEEIVKGGLELITGPKKVELQEKWKHLRVEEVELYLKRVELIREQTELVLEALKSSGH